MCPTSQKQSNIDAEDVLTVFDIDTDRDRLYNGETPDGIEERCFKLCKDFIGGHWSNLELKDVLVRRITGGLVNQFYRVTVRECTEKPYDVGIKIYQEKTVQDVATDGRVNDIIVLKSISDLGIGPRIHGLSTNLAIFDFIDSVYFDVEQQNDEKLLRELIELIARFHNMQMPIVKTSTFPHDYIESGLNKAYDKLNFQSIIEEMDLSCLKSCDLRVEFSQVVEILDNQLKAERVFCHNDFRSQNILVSKSDSRLYLCDVEFACYGYRCNDLSTFLMEWGVGPMRYRIPEDEIIEKVARMYIDAYDRMVPGYSGRPENSVEQIVKEIKVNFLRWCIFLIAFLAEKEQSFLETFPFDYKENLNFCEKIMGFYIKTKTKLIKDKIVEKF